MSTRTITDYAESQDWESDNNFAIACYNMNATSDLELSSDCEPDKTDMREWDITAQQWKTSINLAYVVKSVEDFFGDRDVVYAKIGTANHSSNFWGNDLINELDIDGVIDNIWIAYDNGEYESMPECVIKMLSDLQYDEPEQE
jgi:hypothetical protein